MRPVLGYPPRMLPDEFTWAPRWQHDETEPALVLDGVTVACLLRRVDGSWTARLDAHHPITAPLVLRRCRSRESGIAGIEAWAQRHADRLRAEVAERPRPSGAWRGGTAP